MIVLKNVIFDKEELVMTVDATHNDVSWLVKSSLIHELELAVPYQFISFVEMTVMSIGHLIPGVVSTWLWHGSYAGSHMSM